MVTLIIEVKEDLECLREEVVGMLGDIYEDVFLVLTPEAFRGHTAYVLGTIVFALTAETEQESVHYLLRDMTSFYKYDPKLRDNAPEMNTLLEFSELILDSPAAKAIRRRIHRSLGKFIHERVSIETELLIPTRRLLMRIDV